MFSLIESLISLGSSLSNGFWLLTVAFIWGSTNPLLKKHSRGVEIVKKENKVSQFFAELACLLLNWKYLIAVLLNQSGSILYYITLASADLSLAVPITNSLTFIFTALSSHFLGEKHITRDVLFGMFFVICGASLCVMSQGKSS